MDRLHAHWQPTAPFEGRLLFWLEQPDARRTRHNHPHAATAATAAARLAAAAFGTTAPEAAGVTDRRRSSADARALERGAAEHANVDLLLPGRGASTETHGAWSDTLLHRWRVPAVAFGPEQGIRALLEVVEAQARGGTGLELAASVRYWHRAAGLLLALLARHDVVPALSHGEPRWQARPERLHDCFTSLIQSMPPVCRAETEVPEEAPRATDLLRSFLDAGADAWARSSAGAGPPRMGPNGAVGRYVDGLLQEPRLAGSAGQREWLEQKHRAWVQALHPAGDGPLRAGFRLEAPEADDAPWRLHYLLQARDDPSLQVPADLVWGGDERLAAVGLATAGSTTAGSTTAGSTTAGSAVVRARTAEAREALLTGLGYAARLSEPVRASLDHAEPTGAELTTEEAFTFLRETAPLLEESGFAVFVPPWWGQPRARLGVRVNMTSEQGGVGAGLLGVRQLVRYHWQVSLGGEALDEAAFRALVELKSPLVRLRGRWVRLDPDQAKRALAFFRRRQEESTGGLLDALQLGSREGTEVDGLPLDAVEAEGELRDQLDRLRGDARMEPIPPPAGLSAELRPYQREGLSWLAFLEGLGLGACLADDMGLGKTVQTLAFLQHLAERDRLGGPVLLVCPTSVVANWRVEAGRFTPGLRIMEHHGPDRLAGAAFAAALQETDLVLTSYALARRDAETLATVRWRGAVLDEAQNIKNPHAKGSRTLFGLDAGFRLALTGTPVENRLSELWSIMRFLNPGYLGSLQSYRKTLARPIERHGDEAALATLRRLVGPLVLRRSKRDPAVITDLPDKLEQRVDCGLSTEQASLYEAVVRDALELIEASEGIARRGQVLSMLTQLKQICNHPAHYLKESMPGAPNRSGKLERFLELLEEACMDGDGALVFTQYKQMGDLLVRAVSERLGTGTLFLHGGTPAAKRAAMVERFQDPGGPPVFVLSLKAGGTGLNLTRAAHVFHYDRWWNPAVEAQATDRAYRIGQRQHVHVHTLVTTGTVEERIDELMERKRELADKVVAGGEAGLSELDTETLRALVTLGREVLA